MQISITYLKSHGYDVDVTDTSISIIPREPAVYALSVVVRDNLIDSFMQQMRCSYAQALGIIDAMDAEAANVHLWNLITARQ